ncbi:hypothetical protein TVVG_00051 [Tetraselmis viridis virus SI1]|uniref:hypothetical protein n=1 Tax=Tetraselmis viridis virus S20 TaxID=754070 RepID=UPI0002C15D6E|nr:hypothetical protein TVGG_00017 [Tetraselmis viridis virus S20]AGH31345.1 hypothetical protein TVGG_00017 [Tetraselmis viridis virus S20]AGH31433.1 hypothetical protein TVVG_00051 [Tetraselmis viridis virus SI1]
MSEPVKTIAPLKAVQVLGALAGEHQCLADYHVRTGRVFHDELQRMAKENPDRLGAGIDAAYDALLTHQQLAQHHNEVSQAISLAVALIKSAAD